MNEEIRTIIFDLDGTIYQNTVFHRDYLRFVVEGTKKAAWADALIAYADKVFCGERLIMNAFYRSAHIEAESPEAFFAALQDAYLPDAASENEADCSENVYLGDAWAVVSLLGKALGLLDGARADAVYMRMREKMSADGMQGNPRLRDAIAALGDSFDTVLLSNSYADTANAFLRQLGFDGIFRRTVFSAHKPDGMLEALYRQDAAMLECPGSVLAIGDHAYNDLMPLAKIGARTLWVNPFSHIHEPACDASVHTTDELAAYLEALRRRRQPAC